MRHDKITAPTPDSTEPRPDLPYWARSSGEVLNTLGSNRRGLDAETAARRLARTGPNRLRAGPQTAPLMLFLNQFKNPLVLVLVVAAGISAGVGEVSEAVIIAVIVVASCLLSFTQEFSASRAMAALLQRLSRKANVVRNGCDLTIPVESVVPGDILKFSAGALIPVDGLIIEANDFNVSEAVLTGETFPVLKEPCLAPADASLTGRRNTVLAGTSVRSGTALAVAVLTGPKTEFARVAEALERHVPETEFARGIRHFGTLMTQIMLVMVLIVFLANLLLHRPLTDSLLFSLALAVGLTPELLPAIISVTLASGARRMAAEGVIVRRLDAIENLGSMTLLCTDKTGTLTKGVIAMSAAFDASGQPSDAVLDMARLNAGFQTGLRNALDDAIVAAAKDREFDNTYDKLGEVPYDFQRKRLSVVIRQQRSDQAILICKGAVAGVLETCEAVRSADGDRPLQAIDKTTFEAWLRSWSDDGYRVLAVAFRPLAPSAPIGAASETGLTLAGFLLFSDPPKEGIAATLKALAASGVHIKMITGDNRYIARHTAEAVGLKAPAIVTGDDLQRMSTEALVSMAPRTDIFAEIDPNQKERIVAALRRSGHVVGYLGDGINDAPALHEADIGISVDTAVDVAREAADIVLLDKDVGVLLKGISEGRRTFANTLKYISITTSANFGNMISMAAASLFLPFLPMLAKEVLLNNFLSDIPSMAIASDTVDGGITRAPRQWNIAYIRRFMICFGLISSIFDILTFAFLYLAAQASEAHFQTGWFIESVVTELGIVFVVRTRRPVWKSRPGSWLVWLSLLVLVTVVALPYTPAAGWVGLTPLPLPILAGLGAITLAYLAASEAAKHVFFAYEERAAKPRRRKRDRLHSYLRGI